MVSQVLQGRVVLLASPAHQASPAAPELRAIWVCKVLKDLRVFKVREVRIKSYRYSH